MNNILIARYHIFSTGTIRYLLLGENGRFFWSDSENTSQIATLDCTLEQLKESRFFQQSDALEFVMENIAPKAQAPKAVPSK